MTAVGLGQHGSQAVASGFESLACQFFAIYLQHNSITENSKTLNGSPTKINFGTVRQKTMDG